MTERIYRTIDQIDEKHYRNNPDKLDSYWSLSGAFRIAADKETRDTVFNELDSTALDDKKLAEAAFYFSKEWEAMEQETQSNILATLSAWVATMTASEDLLQWAETLPSEETADITSVLNGGRIGFVVPAYRYGQAGAVVTALLKSRIYNALKKRAENQEDNKPLVFIVDEAQEVATQEDATILTIGRSLGLAMIAATQTVEGIQVALDKTASKWLNIYGSVIAISNKSPQSDAFVAGRCGKVWNGFTLGKQIEHQMLCGSYERLRRQQFLQEHVEKVEDDLQSGAGNLDGFGGALLPPDEIQELLAEPNTALAIVTRGRVPRRDRIHLQPVY